MRHPSYYGLYESNITKEQARKLLVIPHDAFVYSFVGHIKEYKGVLDLINAFKNNGLKDSYLLIAGLVSNDYLNNQINTIIYKTTNIIFRNEFIPDNDIQLYYKSADIVVFPFKKILTSGSVLLAQSFGKPVIIPKINSLLDNIYIPGTYTYKINNINELSNVMKKVYFEKELFVEKSEKKIEDWAKENSWEKFALKTKEAYSKI
ncbi:glycosyltransferase [Thalassobellus sediminis]|uniref:glycosyltransferase n=1 Tax=Thalassobellus sediminis TaxID=3367753 RepID=UPI0037AC763F